MTDGDHWLVLTPEQRVTLKPWLVAWTLALVIQIVAVVAIPICFFGVGTDKVPYLLVPILLGYAGQRLIFIICKMRIDQMAGEPPSWMLLVNSLAMAMVAIAACGYFHFLLSQKSTHI